MGDTHTPAFRRAVSPSTAARATPASSASAAEHAKPSKAELVAVHVVEIDWTLPLDADIAGRSEEVQRVLDLAEAVAEECEAAAWSRSCSRPATSAPRSSTRRSSATPTCSSSGVPFRNAVRRRLRHRPDHPLRPAERAVRRLGGARADVRGGIVKIVIVGCGRVGAALADAYDRAGHEVLDPGHLKTGAFDRLPSTFRGRAIRGDGTDEDVLRRAGAEGADVFLAMTEGDNRNVMAAQLAAEALGIERVVAKINDPVRAEAYAGARASPRSAGPG